MKTITNLNIEIKGFEGTELIGEAVVKTNIGTYHLTFKRVIGSGEVIINKDTYTEEGRKISLKRSFLFEIENAIKKELV